MRKYSESTLKTDLTYDGKHSACDKRHIKKAVPAYLFSTHDYVMT
jgi:hypothetical protein